MKSGAPVLLNDEIIILKSVLGRNYILFFHICACFLAMLPIYCFVQIDGHLWFATQPYNSCLQKLDVMYS